MAQAESKCITRRLLVAGAAALASTATPLPLAAQVPAATPDPILTAIAAHRAALAALDKAAQHLSDVEDGSFDDGGQDRGSGADDDPLLLAAEAAFDAASDAERRAAWALARAKPASSTAAAALLRYAGEVEDDGIDWPDPPDDEDGDWAATFHHSLAAALDAMGPSHV